MPKRVKTKKQKMRSDLRHKIISPALEMTESTTYSLPSIARTEITSPLAKQTFTAEAKGVSTIGYSYLQADLRKTILLTMSIVMVEILIKYYLKF